MLLLFGQEFYCKPPPIKQTERVLGADGLVVASEQCCTACSLNCLEQYGVMLWSFELDSVVLQPTYICTKYVAVSKTSGQHRHANVQVHTNA